MASTAAESACTIVEASRTPARALLFSHPTLEPLAARILQERGAAELLERAPVSYAAFPDGWPNIYFPARAALEHRNAVVLFALHHPSAFLEQASFLIALCRQRLRSLHIIVPYFGPGTMERVARENELATAETTFKLLTAALPPLTGGVPTITVFDAHALATRFYAVDTATVVQASAMEVAREYARRHRCTIVFPDEGASKRFGNDFDGFEQIVCTKKRVGDARIVTFANETPEASTGCALIVDDLAQSGETLAQTARMLLDGHYFGEVRAFVVHAVFPRGAAANFAEGGRHAGLFKRIYVSDTNPVAAEPLLNVKPFEVYSVAPLIVRQLRRDLGDAVEAERRARGAIVRFAAAAPAGACRLLVASTTAVKVGAAHDAVAASGLLGAAFAEAAFHIESGVRAQPTSADETLRGARYRYADLRCHDDTASRDAPTHESLRLCVAIESGIWERELDDGTRALCDSAYVIVGLEGAFRAQACVLSAPHVLSDYERSVYQTKLDALEETRRTHVSTDLNWTTLGELLQARDARVDKHAWFDRAAQLRDAVAAALAAL